ncbi:MAG: S49 family peptidase [Simkaniaceae bacterium]|nr:S49 family peptidase [Simkaniaceae bacterium]
MSVKIARESIFVSSVRAFSSAFFALVGVVVAIAVIAMIFGSLSKPVGFRKMTDLVIEPDADGSVQLQSPHAPVILRIDISGPIMPPKLTAHDIEVQLLDSRTGPLKGERIKGIFLCINTPGGTVTDSNTIYQLLMDYKERYKVPVYAYTNGLCASGGMYVSAAADKTFASDISIVGSVGVIMGPSFNYSTLLTRLGIESKTISEGKDKDMLSSFRPWKEGEDASLVNVAKYTYNHFVDLMVKNHPHLDRTKLIEEYGAQIYPAPEAADYGFIDDGNATYNSALKELVTAAEITEPYQVVRLKPRRQMLAEFIQAQGGIEKLRVLLGTPSVGETPLLYMYETP